MQLYKGERQKMIKLLEDFTNSGLGRTAMQAADMAEFLAQLASLARTLFDLLKTQQEKASETLRERLELLVEMLGLNNDEINDEPDATLA